MTTTPKVKSISDNNKQEESIKSVSLNSSIFKNSTELFENLAIIKSGLNIENDNTAKFTSTLNDLEKEDVQISEIFKNEANVIKELKDNAEYTLNIKDNIFEDRTRKILSKVYNLKENLLYPHFKVEYSSKNKSNIIKIYYYQITVGFDEKNEDNKIISAGRKNKKKTSVEEIKTDKKKDNNASESFVFLDDRKMYMISFKEMPLIFQKSKEGFTNVSIISKDFLSYCDFQIEKKSEKLFETSFDLALVNKELTEIKGKMVTTKYYMEKSSEEEKKKFEEKYQEYQNSYNSLLEKYSNEKIMEHLINKKKELETLNSSLKNEKNDINNINESGQKINELKNEIEEYEILSKKIIININKLDQEFDGLFFSTKEITLSNNIGDKLIIPSKSPIIVEVKNHCKYNKIIENIRMKKNLLESLKLDKKNFYYIGILRGIDVGLQEKLKINNSKKHFDFSKVIVIYPDGTNFLGESLYEEKNEIKEESSLVLEELGKLMNKIIIMDQHISKLENEVQEMKKKLDSIAK